MPTRFRLRWIACFASLGGLTLVAACDRGPEMAPVSGTVKYNGEPLEKGTVMLQPPQGQPARGRIQPDGSFEVSTYKEGDGAVVGSHRVRITSYERPQTSGEQILGKLLIPRHYTFFEQSGLTLDVTSGENTVTFELTD